VGQRILIAEDDTELRDILRLVLTEEGFEIVTCGDGQAAMDIITAARKGDMLPNIIILDLNMPWVDGWKVAAWLEENPELRDIPVIVISATEEHGEKAKSLHADAYLVKPFTGDEILGVVGLFSLLGR
jgi:CheY-like chemotaxis protein